MHQPFAVPSVYFIAVLIIEESSDVLQSFRNSAMDSRSALIPSLSRSKCESRITGGDLRNALSRKDVAHVN